MPVGRTGVRLTLVYSFGPSLVVLTGILMSGFPVECLSIRLVTNKISHVKPLTKQCVVFNWRWHWDVVKSLSLESWYFSVSLQGPLRMFLSNRLSDLYSFYGRILFLVTAETNDWIKYVGCKRVFQRLERFNSQRLWRTLFPLTYQMMWMDCKNPSKRVKLKWKPNTLEYIT